MNKFSLAFITWLAVFLQPIICSQADIAGRMVMLCSQLGFTAEFIESENAHLQEYSDCECPSILHNSHDQGVALSEDWTHPAPRMDVLITSSASRYNPAQPRAPPTA